MNKTTALFLSFFTLSASVSFADQEVRGYTRKDGTYVRGYTRSDSNDTRNDNYSTRGNVNPYTGSYGTKPRDEDSGYGGYGKQRKSNSYYGSDDE